MATKKKVKEEAPVVEEKIEEPEKEAAPVVEEKIEEPEKEVDETKEEFELKTEIHSGKYPWGDGVCPECKSMRIFHLDYLWEHTENASMEKVNLPENYSELDEYVRPHIEGFYCAECGKFWI